MGRNSSTRSNGSGFDYATIQAVWQKGQNAAGYDAAYIREDSCGALISRSDYGKLSDRGWEIDHIFPVSSGGSDDISNLQPLQWENNRSKGDSTSSWECARR